MQQFLHISDLHIHSDPAKNTGVIERLAFLRRKYPFHRPIITGDVTDDGSESQYEIAAKMMWNHAPAYVCPGNHDYGPVGNFFSRSCERRFDQFLPQMGTYAGRLSRPVVDMIANYNDSGGGYETIALIGLDSNLATKSPLDFACGKIGLWQRYLLARILRRHADKVRIVYFHHHPMDRGNWTGMKDAGQLMAILRGNCELVLFGHKHRAQRIFDGVPMLAAGKFDECEKVSEITIEGEEISIREVPVV